MSELKAIESATAVIEKVYLVYRKSEADKVIAEKDKEIAELKAACVNTDNSAVIENMANELERLRPMETALELAEADNRGYLARIKELEAKLEDVQASAYAESVDAGMRERRLKRALFLAHAYKVKFKRWWLHLALDCEAREIHPDTKTINRIIRKIGNCEKSERKCRAKAEEYK